MLQLYFYKRDSFSLYPELHYTYYRAYYVKCSSGPRTYYRKGIMIRPLIVAAVLVAVVGLIVLMVLSERKRRISNAARFAPHALSSYGVPQPVIDLIVDQGRRLEQGRDIMRGMLGDPILDMSLPPSHANKMQEWLNATDPKEIN